VEGVHESTTIPRTLSRDAWSAWNAGRCPQWPRRSCRSLHHAAEHGAARRRRGWSSGVTICGWVARRSNGQLKVEVYPSGQVAKEKEAIDGLTTGVIDFAVTSTPELEALFARFELFNLPFLFKDSATAFRIIDGPLGGEFFADLESKGIVGLGWGTTGFKEVVTAGKAVVVPEDMKGLRIRIQPSAVSVATYRALGAIPVAIDTSEVFTALSQHTLDGTESILDAVASRKWDVILKHVAMTNHVFVLNPLLGSKRKIDGLPLALQRIVKEEGRVAALFFRRITADQTLADIQAFKKNGVAFSEVQYPAFRKAMDPVYAQFQSKLGGDLIDRVSRAANGK
jgi:TRAP-type transport system periplasmic protein